MFLAVGALFFSSLAASAHAQSTPEPAQTAEQPTAQSDRGQPSTADQTPSPVVPEAEQLHLAFVTYLWLTGFSGTLGVSDVEVDVDVTFSDILDEADKIFGLMGAIDARYKRLVFQVNGAFTTAETSGERTVFRDVALEADIDIDSAWFECFGGYRFVDAPIGSDEDPTGRLTFDGFVGARVTTLQLSASFSAEASVTLPNGTELEAGRNRDIDETKAWFEPFIGARLGVALGEHWTLAVRGDVGGFGVDDSEFSWQTVGFVGYTWRNDGWDLNLFGGYRALGQDYSDGGFTWNVITHGPILGAQFTLSF